MCLFKKKKKLMKEEVQRDVDIIAKNVTAVDVVIELVQDDATADELRALQDKIKYMNPSVDEKVIKVDMKIADELQELKISLVKSIRNDEKIAKQINNLKLLVIERESAK